MMSVYAICESITEENKKGSMIAHFIPLATAREIQEPFKGLSGDFVEEREMHITLGLVRNFTGKEDKFKRVLKRFCEDYKPFHCSIKSLGTFLPNDSNDQKHVLYADPECSELKEIHNRLISTMKRNNLKVDNGGFEDYKPHITIGYFDEEPSKDSSIDLEFIIDSLTFTVDNKRFKVGLG